MTLTVNYNVLTGEDIFRGRRPPTPEQIEAPERFPLAHPTTPLASQAAELHAAWADKAAYIREIRNRIADRKAEVGALEDAYHAEVKRAAEAGEVSDRDVELLAQIKSFAPELREVWDPRLHAAIDTARDAWNAFFSFVDSHSEELLEEQREAAEDVALRYTAEREKMAQRLLAIERERAALADAAALYVSNTPPARCVPADPSRPPIPSTEDPD